MLVVGAAGHVSIQENSTYNGNMNLDCKINVAVVVYNLTTVFNPTIAPAFLEEGWLRGGWIGSQKNEFLKFFP